MRIPINDNYSEKLAPYLQKAFQFLGIIIIIVVVVVVVIISSPK